MNKLIFSVLICFLFTFAKAQEKAKDKQQKETITALNVGVGLNLTGADLNDRYGLFSDLNFGLTHKNIKNLVLGFQSSFLLGNNVFQDDLYDLFANSNGQITGTDGTPASLGVLLRGNKTSLSIGKIVKTFKNDNSGFFVSVNTGYISHKIKYVDGRQNLPQLTEQYLIGFDKKANGFFVEEFVGILFLSDAKLINFKVGLTFMQGFTQDKRDYFYASDFLPSDNRKETAFGIRAHWILPFYREQKVAERYYIN